MGQTDKSNGLDLVPVVYFVHNLKELHVEVRSQATGFTLVLRDTGSGRIGFASGLGDLFVHLAENWDSKFKLDGIDLTHIVKSTNPVFVVDLGDVVIELTLKLLVLLVDLVREGTLRAEVELLDHVVGLVNSGDERVSPDGETTIEGVRNGHGRALLGTSNIK
jgi:hypothetical protein